jgi:polar amino acid transport system ATP-binding protein
MMMTTTTPQPPVEEAEDADRVVRVRGLHKRFGSVHALRGVDLDVRPGTVTALIGPSGSGKSTLLRCINHLEQPTQGSVEVDGELMGYVQRRGQYQPCGARALAQQRRATGMVFQHFNLFAHRTAMENVMEGPVGGHREPRPSARARAEELLDSVGLSDKCDAYPAELSGGQQQRVAIARALASRPKVLLLDEPTSALDPELVGEVLAVIRALTETGVTMLITTHEISFAEDVAHTVIFMDSGVVVERGGPEQVIRRPQNERTRRFLTHLRA